MVQGDTQSANLRKGTIDFKALPTSDLIDNSITDFDLYLRTEAGAKVLYAPSPYRWLRDEVSRLVDMSHEQLFYSSEDQGKVEAYYGLIPCRRDYERMKASASGKSSSPLSPEETLSERTSPEKRLIDLTDAVAEFTKVLYRYPLTAGALDHGKVLAHELVETVSADPTCVVALGHLGEHDIYTYYHSARVAAYSLALASRMGLTTKLHLEEIAIGALLHDVGKSMVGLEVLNKPGILTKDEWAEMKKHPEHGLEVTEGAKLSAVSRGIILHHHERFDGSGYPHGLSERELLPEVKIAAFADIFDALTTARPYQVSRSRYEALEFIRQRLLRNIDTDAFAAMIAILDNKNAASQKG